MGGGVRANLVELFDGGAQGALVADDAQVRVTNVVVQVRISKIGAIGDDEGGCGEGLLRNEPAQ